MTDQEVARTAIWLKCTEMANVWPDSRAYSPFDHNCFDHIDGRVCIWSFGLVSLLGEGSFELLIVSSHLHNIMIPWLISNALGLSSHNNCFWLLFIPTMNSLCRASFRKASNHRSWPMLSLVVLKRLSCSLGLFVEMVMFSNHQWFDRTIGYSSPSLPQIPPLSPV